MTRPTGLSRREREIMEVIYREGQATASEVQAALADPPSYSAVRALLRILEEKGHVRHQEDGPRYLYQPTVPRHKAAHEALHELVKTFYEGSAGMAAAALLDRADSKKMSDAELDRLEALIKRARKDGR
jgi:BlaI family transcriptional regulator, penicillinase repressor